ncbi:hypothetical protein HDV00_005760 [Rhizophlyctis rosea]|nr:hypothetical protein HDV00_005760 [Rhizophlyctis rosea]
MPDDIVIQYREEPLFPEFTPDPFRELSQYEEELFEIANDYKKKVKDLPYYLELPPPKPDIERYSDRFKNNRERSKLKSLVNVPANLAFFPQELHSVKDPSKRTMSKKVKGGLDLKRLEALEREEADGKGDEEVVDEEQEEEMIMDEEEEDALEDDNDYAVGNYWDDDYDALDDGGGASGGEEY